MENGWIKLHRKLKNKGYYKKSQYVHLWIHLLFSANHKEKEFMWNNQIIIVKEGQMITGRKSLAEETGIPESTIENILKFLETQHQIQQQKTTKYRLITIVKWEQYQKPDSKSNNRATTEQQQADTNKNVKKEKNVKNINISAETSSADVDDNSKRIGGQSTVSPRSAQVRLGKVRLSKVNTMSASADAFDQFWNKYPKKELKKKSREIWLRKKPPLQEILKFIEMAVQTDRWQKGYVKQPTAFLNGECWNDDIASYNDAGEKTINRDLIIKK